MKKYQKAAIGAGIVVASFGAGYAARKALDKPSPDVLQTRIESIVSENPKDYQTLARHSREFWHQALAFSIPSASDGYAGFNDVRIGTRKKGANTIAVLVNKRSNDVHPILYVNGKMAVGSYQERLESVKFETLEQGKNLVIEAREKAEEKARSFLEFLRDIDQNLQSKKPEWLKKVDKKATDLSYKLRDVTVETIDWSKKQARDFYDWIKGTGGSPEVTKEIEQAIKDKIGGLVEEPKIATEEITAATPEVSSATNANFIDELLAGKHPEIADELAGVVIDALNKQYDDLAGTLRKSYFPNSATIESSTK